MNLADRKTLQDEYFNLSGLPRAGILRPERFDNNNLILIAQNYEPEKIILFGSYATGTANDDSDLDFIIVKKTDKPKHKRGREVRRFLLGAMIPMDLKIYTPDEFEIEQNLALSFLNSAMKNSIVIYERND